MKYIIILGDGMADYPIPELNGKTPLMEANTPCMDRIAKEGITGLFQTIESHHNHPLSACRICMQ